MTWSFVLWLALSACAPESKPFDPTKPHRYRVLRGDTWQSITSKRGVEVEDLRAWNGLAEDHVLIPGQVLMIYPGGEGAPTRVAVAAPALDDPAAPAGTEAAATDGVASGEQVAAAGRAARTIDRPVGPAGTALLSLLDELGEGEALQAVPSVQPQGDPVDHVLGARRGGLGGGGQVDTTEVAIDRKPAPIGAANPRAIPVPKLPKASPKTCLKADLDVDVAEDQVASIGGLDRAAIKSGMRPALTALQACLPAGGGGPHELHVEVSLGCDGLVYQTETLTDAGLPAPVVACVEGVIDQASFAAAAGATTFLYPVVLGY